MRPIGCPETSVRNYNYMPLTPEDGTDRMSRTSVRNYNYTPLSPEDVTDSLSRNVGNKLQLHALEP